MGGLERSSLVMVLGLAVLLPQGVGAEEASDEKRPPMTGSVYDKPFLKRTGQGAVGGYIDIELLADENGSTFDQHRFVPFLYGQISDRVSVASEIEFEHGGFVEGDEDTDGEIKVEFAHVDISASEWLNFRGGVILTPLGRFNLVHDSPVNDLTERPLVANAIIPTTLSEAGFGIFGSAYPSPASVVTYEAYLVNGFNEDILQFGPNASSDPVLAGVRIRNGRSSGGRDNNNSRAFAGRLGFSPALGVDFGASVHTGRYTDRDTPDGNLTIAAFDGIYTTGPLELLGEFALSTTGIPAFITGPDDVSQNGYYVQLNWHFLPGAVKGLPNSIFTAVTRFDQVDFDTDDDGSRNRRWSVGVNFRPTYGSRRT